jgi:hypothetical protein
MHVSSNEQILTCCGYTFDLVRGLSQFDQRYQYRQEQALVEGRGTLSTSEDKLSVLHNVYGSESELFQAIWRSTVHSPWISDAWLDTAPSARVLQGLFSADDRDPWLFNELRMKLVQDAGESSKYMERN